MIVELYRENYSSYDELAVCANNMKRYTISIRWVFDYRKRLKSCESVLKYINTGIWKGNREDQSESEENR